MSNVEFKLDLGQVDFGNLHSDEDLRREARRLLPTALTQVGEKVAGYAWDELQKGFRGISGFKPNSSSGERQKFIREGGRNYSREVSTADRLKVENTIISQMRERKHQLSVGAQVSSPMRVEVENVSLQPKEQKMQHDPKPDPPSPIVEPVEYPDGDRIDE